MRRTRIGSGRAPKSPYSGTLAQAPEDTSERQKTTETNLREEILRLLTTNVRQRSGQQGKGTAAEGM